MRIWIVNHYYSSPLQSGITRHHNLAKQLIKLGHEVLILASTFNHYEYQFVAEGIQQTKSTQVIDGVPIAWISTPSYKGNTIMRLWSMICFSWKLLAIKKHLKSIEAPDVIIGSSPHLFAALSAAKLAKKFKVPFVLEIRDLWPETFVMIGEMSRWHPVILIMKKIEKWLYEKADGIVTVLPHAVAYIKKYLSKQEKMFLWLPNFVDMTQIPAIPVVTKKNEKFTVMYAGSHGFANSLDTVVEAAKILQNRGFLGKIELRLVGEGPDKIKLIALAEKLGVTLVKFEAPVSKNEIYNILATADAYLLVLKDSLLYQKGISPNKLFDYMAMGKPVVFCGHASFNPVAEFEAGITTAPTPCLLADAIEEIYSLSPEKRHEMGLRAYTYVSANHDVNQLVLKLNQWLLNIVK